MGFTKALDATTAVFRRGKSEAATDDIRLCSDIWPALNGVWPFDAEQLKNLAAFLREQTGRIRSHFPHTTDDDVVNVVKKLRELKDQPREYVESQIALTLSLSNLTLSEKKSSTRLLDIAAMLCLTVNINSDDSTTPKNTTSIRWQPGQSLSTIVSSHLTSDANGPHNSEGIISERLSVANLVTHYGLEVDWTDNLDEHLNINWSNRVLSIYQHKIWLHAHLGPNNNCPIPPDVIGECLDTLNLLFPHYDTRTRSFLKSRGRNFNLMGTCGRKVPRDIKDYQRWGSRLSELLEVLDGPQSGFRQLLPRADRGNLLDSINFWIAAFVAILTVVSFVFGLVGIIYAKNSYDVSAISLRLTRDQYLLSLAQACSDPDSSESVLEFCQR